MLCFVGVAVMFWARLSPKGRPADLPNSFQLRILQTHFFASNDCATIFLCLSAPSLNAESRSKGQCMAALHSTTTTTTTTETQTQPYPIVIKQGRSTQNTLFSFFKRVAVVGRNNWTRHCTLVTRWQPPAILATRVERHVSQSNALDRCCEIERGGLCFLFCPQHGQKRIQKGTRLLFLPPTLSLLNTQVLLK